METAPLVALAAALQAAILAVVLWCRGSRRLLANRWLALLMALAAIRLLNQFAFRHPIFGVPLSPRFTIPVLFAFTPLLYLYLRSLVQPHRRPRLSDIGHAVPALVVLAYTVPFYLVAVIAPRSAWTSYGSQLRAESTVLNAALVAQCIWYLVHISHLLPVYDRGVREISSTLEVARFRWTRWLWWALVGEVIILLAIVGLQVGRVAPGVLAYRDVVLSLYMGIVVYGTAFMALQQPALFAAGGGDSTSGRKYEKSSLAIGRAQEAQRLVRSLMEIDRLYLDDELSLPALAARTGLPVAHVSQVINEQMGCSFYDLVNGYRVEDAKRRLVDPRTEHQKVLAIGLDVGFRSKAAFNRVFKQRTGLTPTEYREWARSASLGSSSAVPPTGGQTRPRGGDRPDAGFRSG